MQGEGLMKMVIEARMKGGRTRGRSRMGTIDYPMEGTYTEMKRKAKTDRNGRFGCCMLSAYML